MSGADSFVDRAGPCRAGEELDAAQVDAYLKPRIPGLEGAPEIGQFARGASNLTYLLRYPGRELVLRRPPFGHKAKGAHDMLREARVMAALKPHYPVVPAVLATCDDPAVLGCDFYVMERIAGIIPRQDLPAGLGFGEAETRRLCVNVVDKLVELHSIALTSDPSPESEDRSARNSPSPLGESRGEGLLSLGKGEGYVQRQVEGWSRRFRDARTEDVADFEAVMAWLAARRPAREVAIRVIHGDFRFDNVVLDPADPFTVIGVLDWEMATLGDPLMDLGNALAYWVQADDDEYFRRTRRQPTDAPGMLTRAEVVAHYAARTGLAVGNFDFYEVFGLFRVAVIVQQIWRRYREGHTKDAQFAAFGPLVNYLDGRCRRLVAASQPGA
ncbi:MAG: phosphotransferase family protein [Betaproteobacteria bacterium]|nr:phosphotransferase family protein [Betaproteobacteria bacterium]